MLSQTAEHALRAVLYLARQDEGKPIPAEQVADALGAPRNYLSKTLNALAKHGILASTAGRKGGFSLAVAPAALSVARVLEAFDTPGKRAVCLLGDQPCSPQSPCQAHARWSDVFLASRAPLEGSMIADLLGEASPPPLLPAASK